jgi:DNA-directed RNA polymerase subunit H (RpoH/RPB5)
VERQSERGEQDIEKDEKESLLDDLKAKKEDGAKAPKKEAVEKAAKSKGGEAI